MQARGQLVIEHRLIQQMLNLIKSSLEDVDRTKSIDPYFVDTAVDFIRVYADRTHHGKEEDILFRDLRKKYLSKEDLQVMDKLISDHVFFRSTTKSLIEDNGNYRKGDNDSLDKITTHLKTLVEFYPQHMKKEDEIFFPASMAYFSDEEDQAMLVNFCDFDRKMIHEKYKALVKSLEEK